MCAEPEPKGRAQSAPSATFDKEITSVRFSDEVGFVFIPANFYTLEIHQIYIFCNVLCCK